jgi:hypothetical protein
MTVTLYKDPKPVGIANLYDAKEVLADRPSLLMIASRFLFWATVRLTRVLLGSQGWCRSSKS